MSSFCSVCLCFVVVVVVAAAAAAAFSLCYGQKLQSDHGGRSSHTHNNHSHRLKRCKRWSLVWAALTGTQSCTVFGSKDVCGSTALAMPKSRGMNGQIDWQAQQSHLV